MVDDTDYFEITNPRDGDRDRDIVALRSELARYGLVPPDYFEYEPKEKRSMKIKPLFRSILAWVCYGLIIGLAIGFLIFPAHAEGGTPSSNIGVSSTPQNWSAEPRSQPPAQDACQAKHPDCVPAPTHVTWCGKWFKDFDVSDHYQQSCLKKLPRLFETNATDDAKRYMLCHCEFQGSVWTRRDP